MANAPKGLLPDGSPSKALNEYRRKAIARRKDKGQVTPHFNLKEFSTHDGSYVPTRAWDAIERLCKDYLEPLRKRFGACRILSGYRHRKYNRSIRGALHSQHIYDETPDSIAADVRFAKGSPTEWMAVAKLLRAKKKKGGGIGVYPITGFVHIDNRNYNADWSGR